MTSQHSGLQIARAGMNKRNWVNRRRIVSLSLTTVVAAGAFSAMPVLAGTAAAAPAGNTLLVAATHSSNSGNCQVHACATIQYAVNQASPGDTVNVGKGTYHEQVQITKAISLVSTHQRTVIDGAGLDSQVGSQFGVVQFGDTNGPASISGFTITNPVASAYDGQPVAISVYNTTSSDPITISNNTITEGTADTSANTEYPIGIATYNNGPVVVQNNKISGFFTGTLFEDSASSTFNSNTVTALVPSLADADNPSYPPVGAKFLADDGGTYTNQNASQNQFKKYAGAGIEMQAGYSSGAHGNVTGTESYNYFNLDAFAPDLGAGAFALDATTTGSTVTATLIGNSGVVRSPDLAISENQWNTALPAPDGPGIVNYTESGDSIRVK